MSNSARTALVTGATGFVAASIVRDLAHEGYRVVAYDVAAPSSLLERYWTEHDGDVIFEQASVLDEDHLAAVFARHSPALVVHAAAVTAVHRNHEVEHGQRMFEVNVFGTLRVLAASGNAHVERLMYISSAGLYPPDSDPASVSEDRPTRAGNLYLITKEAAEKLCLRWGELHNLSVVVARLAQPYGPLERDTGSRPVLSVVYQLASAAIRSGHVYVSDDNYVCDWTCTFDIARGIRLLAEAPGLEHRVFNLSSGVPARLTELLNELGQLVPGARFEFSGDERLAPVRTEDDPRRGPLDIGRLQAAVGFRPEYDLRRGLQASMEWWRQA